MTPKYDIRHSKRVPVLQEAEVKSDDNRFSGTIENISESGLNIIVPSDDCVTSFIPGSKVTVTFRPEGKEVTIQCEINWARIDKNPSHGIMYTLAMEISQMTPDFKKYVKNKK